jgi:hypothetical protein
MAEETSRITTASVDQFLAESMTTINPVFLSKTFANSPHFQDEFAQNDKK